MCQWECAEWIAGLRCQQFNLIQSQKSGCLVEMKSLSEVIIEMKCLRRSVGRRYILLHSF